jgi:hypothetical protein
MASTNRITEAQQMAQTLGVVSGLLLAASK